MFVIGYEGSNDAVWAMTLEAAADAELPDPAPLVALAFLAPWVIVALFLPGPWRVVALGLVTLLAVLLLAGGAWAFRMALAKGLDAPRWSFLTVLTLGFAMVPLAFAKSASSRRAETYVCTECARPAPTLEPFCFGCGATS